MCIIHVPEAVSIMDLLSSLFPQATLRAVRVSLSLLRVSKGLAKLKGDVNGSTSSNGDVSHSDGCENDDGNSEVFASSK